MFRIYNTLSLLLFASFLSAQIEVPIDSVAAYVGKTVKVCSNVAGTFVTNGDKPVTYLNLGADYPNSKLTIVIFQRDLIKFPIAPSDHYKGKNVCVTGDVTTYKDKLQIICDILSQINII